MDTQPKTGLGSVAETNRLLGRDYLSAEADRIKAQDPQSVANFRAANPNLEFGAQDVLPYHNAKPINSQALSGSALPVNIPSQDPQISPAIPMAAKAQADLDAYKEAEALANKAYEGVAQIEEKKKGVLDYLGLGESKASGFYKEALDATSSQVDPAKKELANIRTKESETLVQYRAESDAIKARGDITQEAQQGLKFNADDRYGRVLADLAIRKSAQIQNVADLREGIQQKLALQLAPIEREQKFYKDFVLNNLDQLSDDEKAKANQIIAQYDKRKSEITAKENGIASLLSTAMQNGVKIPDNVVSQVLASGSILEATSALSRAGISLQDPLDAEIKRANLANTYSQIAERNASSVGVSSSGTVYKKDASGNVVKDTQGNPVLDDSPKARALQTILGSSKFSKEQKADVVRAINGGEDPAVVIKNQAKNIMGQTLATDLDKTETARTQLVAINDLLKTYYANGGSTSLFTGKYEQVVNKLGQVKNPKLVEISTEIALAMQEYRLAVTGTAASIQEDARIDNVFPGIKSSKGLNEARLNATLKSFDQKIDSKYRNTLGSAYDELKKAEQEKASVKQNSKDPLDLGLGAFNPLGI